ncbi:hypothetical protein GCM10028803_57280 [Larkinella knui]|uniref:Uncharacterized protein n=1 Tax=Larkinella knui TaxID=2025310 RepID=A0A3P1CHT3_9BACT|nr:hypothetical protein [Larkinella knui]RRB12829.1 hypothetical protein EHT87_21895 [Larkinella knui]
MTTDVHYQTGKMVKDPRTMTPEERSLWQKQCTENAREYLFSIGQPLVYKRPDGHVVAEHKDGRVLVIQ